MTGASLATVPTIMASPAIPSSPRRSRAGPSGAYSSTSIPFRIVHTLCSATRSRSRAHSDSESATSTTWRVARAASLIDLNPIGPTFSGTPCSVVTSGAPAARAPSAVLSHGAMWRCTTSGRSSLRWRSSPRPPRPGGTTWRGMPSRWATPARYPAVSVHVMDTKSPRRARVRERSSVMRSIPPTSRDGRTIATRRGSRPSTAGGGAVRPEAWWKRRRGRRTCAVGGRHPRARPCARRCRGR